MIRHRKTSPRGSTLAVLLIVLGIFILIGVAFLVFHLRQTAPPKVVAAATVVDPGASVISPISGRTHQFKDFPPVPGNEAMVFCPDTHKPFPRGELIKQIEAKGGPKVQKN